MVPNSVRVYQNHSPQKKSLENFTHNFSFEVYLKFPYSMMHLFNTNILHMFKFVNVCWIFFLNKIFWLKLMQILEMSKNKYRSGKGIHPQAPRIINFKSFGVSLRQFRI
jgi:hypothetical protein